MATMAKTKITPRAKHPSRTQEFIAAIQEALDTFEDEISSLTDDIRGKATRNMLKPTVMLSSQSGTWHIL